MTATDDDIDWSLTTREGSRRAQLRRWLTLSVRERFEAIEQMALLAERLAHLRRGTDAPASKGGVAARDDTQRA